MKKSLIIIVPLVAVGVIAACLIRQVPVLEKAYYRS